MWSCRFSFVSNFSIAFVNLTIDVSIVDWRTEGLQTFIVLVLHLVFIISICRRLERNSGKLSVMAFILLKNTLRMISSCNVVPIVVSFVDKSGKFMYSCFLVIANRTIQ